MISPHSPIPCELDAQADTCVRLGPLRPNCIETWADAAFAMSMGTRNGDNRLGPRSSMSTTSLMSVSSPPTPVAIAVPTRSGSFTVSRPASLSACDAAATPRCVKRSVRRASLRSMYCVASKPFTSPAICVSYGAGSKREMRVMPLRPCVSESQLLATSSPSGVTMPMPVTTTRRVISSRSHARRGSLTGAPAPGPASLALSSRPRRPALDHEADRLQPLDALREMAHERVGDRGHVRVRKAAHVRDDRHDRLAETERLHERTQVVADLAHRGEMERRRDPQRDDLASAA